MVELAGRRSRLSSDREMSHWTWATTVPPGVKLVRSTLTLKLRHASPSESRLAAAASWAALVAPAALWAIDAARAASRAAASTSERAEATRPMATMTNRMSMSGMVTRASSAAPDPRSARSHRVRPSLSTGDWARA